MPGMQQTMCGVYDWVDDSCRIVPLEDSEDGLRAEIYVAGEGFRPTSLTDVWHKWRPISQIVFDTMVAQRKG